MRKTLVLFLWLLVIAVALVFLSSSGFAGGFTYFKKKAVVAAAVPFACDNTYLICDAFTGTDGAQYDNSYWDNLIGNCNASSSVTIDNNRAKFYVKSTNSSQAYFYISSKTTVSVAATTKIEFKVSGTPSSTTNNQTLVLFQDAGGRYVQLNKQYDGNSVSLNVASSAGLNQIIKDPEDDGPHIYQIAFNTDTNHIDVFRDGVKIGYNLSTGVISWTNNAKLYLGAYSYTSSVFETFYYDYAWVK